MDHSNPHIQQGYNFIIDLTLTTVTYIYIKVKIL